jgi:hypothetical protein
MVGIREAPKPPSDIEYSIDRAPGPGRSNRVRRRGRSIPINDKMRFEDINQVFSDMRAPKLDGRMILISFEARARTPGTLAASGSAFAAAIQNLMRSTTGKQLEPEIE